MRGNNQKEVEELETQLRIMSQAAAEAIERASRLESELEASRSLNMSRSNSYSSSLSENSLSAEDRLNTLESALDAIFQARTELSLPYNYQYI